MDVLAFIQDSTEIIFEGKIYPAQKIREDISDLADRLTVLRSSHRPFVHLVAANCPKAIVAYFATLKAGLAPVLIDPETGPIENEEMRCDAPPSAIIRVNPRTVEWDYDSEIVVSNSSILTQNDGDALEDVAAIVYTAAEDGFSKGAILTWNNLMTTAQSLVDCLNVQRSSVSCALLPFHHLFGLQTGLLAPLLIGASVLVVDISDLKHVARLANDIERWHVSEIYTIPALYYLFAKIPEVRQRFASVRVISSGGYKLSSSISDAFYKKAGKVIQEGYGLTEASPCCAYHWIGDGIRISSVGRAFPRSEISIQNANDLPVSIGTIGEVCVCGANVMKGYLNKPAATQHVLRNGWLHTGDMGYLDTDGFLTLTGLKKKMLNVGGRKVYPAELERLLSLHENIGMCEVYGLPNEMSGDTVAVRVLLRNDTESARGLFQRWCRMHISSYKVPRQFNFQ